MLTCKHRQQVGFSKRILVVLIFDETWASVGSMIVLTCQISSLWYEATFISSIPHLLRRDWASKFIKQGADVAIPNDICIISRPKHMMASVPFETGKRRRRMCGLDVD